MDVSPEFGKYVKNCIGDGLCVRLWKNMKHSTLLVSSVAAVAVLVSCTSGVPESRYDTAMLETLPSLVCEYRIPVLQYCYTSPGRDLDGVVTAADTLFESGPVVDRSSIFQAASLSKPLFAYIVMKLADQGKIDLDAPLSGYVDTDRFEDREMAEKLTARTVLCHRTGLPNWAAGPSSDEWPSSAIRFRYRPDSCFSYSGEGYAFLQRAVERIEGKPIDETAQELVFGPLNMPNTSYSWLPQYDTLALNGFNADGRNRGQGRHPRANVAYTLRTNAVEYSRFLAALAKGEGLSEAARKEMFTLQTPAQRYAYQPRGCDAEVSWCLGFGSVRGEWFWHWGDNGSFKSLWIMRPESGETFVYFTNSAHGHEIVDTLLTGMLKEELPIGSWINDQG